MYLSHVARLLVSAQDAFWDEIAPVSLILAVQWAFFQRVQVFQRHMRRSRENWQGFPECRLGMSKAFRMNCYLLCDSMVSMVLVVSPAPYLGIHSVWQRLNHVLECPGDQLNQKIHPSEDLPGSPDLGERKKSRISPVPPAG